MKVREITGEPMTWWVESRSEPGKEHRADWFYSTPNCTCHDWSMRHREVEAKSGRHYLCAHLIAARDHCWSKLCEDIREQNLEK